MTSIWRTAFLAFLRRDDSCCKGEPYGRSSLPAGAHAGSATLPQIERLSYL
jgi:hypothetical protein